MIFAKNKYSVMDVELLDMSAEFDKGSGLELEGEINGGLGGEVANTLMFGGGLSFELVGGGEIESGMRVVLQPQAVGRGLRVELVEKVAEILRVALLGDWIVTSNTDSSVVSSVASSIGQPTKSKKVSWTIKIYTYKLMKFSL